MLGRLTALALVKQGFQVALHDSGGREGAQSAAYVAAAMLAPMAEAVDATALVLALVAGRLAGLDRANTHQLLH